MFPFMTKRVFGFSIVVLALIFTLWQVLFDIDNIYPMDPILNPKTPNVQMLRKRHDLMKLKGKHPPFPSSRFENIDWFVQISDLHISVFRNYEIIPDLKNFINHNLNIIKPSVVLVTGDITDAKTGSWYSSKQSKPEWEAYKFILDSTGIAKRLLWLDIRGNHDTFSVQYADSEDNYFREFAIQGQQDRVFRVTHTLQNQEKVEFIGVDASPVPGPKRPYNFFGILDKELLNDINEELHQSENSSHVFVFGHYPTSTMHSDSLNIKHILGQASVYLCGHLHTLASLIPRMFTRQPSGYLELELGDWKGNRMYRIIAIDHGMISFVDVKSSDWPTVLITNPKNSLFNIPHREPLDKMSNSTHIRILCFTFHPPCDIRVSIDGIHVGMAKQVQENKPLYTLPWQPSEFTLNGMHSIKVNVEDQNNMKKELEQMFCLGFHCNLEFELLPRLFLMANFLLLFKLVFWTAFVINMTLLVVSKFIARGYIRTSHYNHPMLAKLHGVLVALSNNVELLNTLIMYNLYLVIGPWFIGELVDGYNGFCFLHGMVIEGKYVPGSITYFLGGVHIMMFNVPLTLYIGSLCKLHTRETRGHVALLSWLLFWLCYHTAFTTFLPYGIRAAIFSPAYLLSIPFVMAVRRKALYGKTAPPRSARD